MSTSKGESWLYKIGGFLEKNATTMVLILLLCSIPVRVVYAGAAEDAWNGVMDFLVPWVGRLGGAVMFIGGIDFALGFKNDDAEGKTRGLRTLIAGAIVIAVGVSSDVFLFTTP